MNKIEHAISIENTYNNSQAFLRNAWNKKHLEFTGYRSLWELKEERDRVVKRKRLESFLYKQGLFFLAAIGLFGASEYALPYRPAIWCVFGAYALTAIVLGVRRGSSRSEFADYLDALYWKKLLEFENSVNNLKKFVCRNSGLGELGHIEIGLAAAEAESQIAYWNNQLEIVSKVGDLEELLQIAATNLAHRNRLEQIVSAIDDCGLKSELHEEEQENVRTTPVLN